MDMVTKCTSNKNDKDAKGPRIRDNHVNKRWKSWEPFNPDIFFRKHTWTPPLAACVEINFVSLGEDELAMKL